MRRLVLLTCGFVAVGLGTVGIVVPGLPTTGFFVLAAACFARSSPRFERWVLDLPGVGPMVRDHRDGPRHAPSGQGRRHRHDADGVRRSARGPSGSPVAAAVILGAGAIGTWYVGWRVPDPRGESWPAGRRSARRSAGVGLGLRGHQVDDVAHGDVGVDQVHAPLGR